MEAKPKVAAPPPPLKEKKEKRKVQFGDDVEDTTHRKVFLRLF